MYVESREESEQPAEDEQEAVMPPLVEGETLKLRALDPKQHFTQPPPRFTEASLVKTLEDLGIGRPSTYAQILGTIQDREYVRRDKGTLFPTELGIQVTDMLVPHFPEVMDVEFTAQLEESLDKIEEGNADWQETVAAFYKEFAKDLAKAGKKMENFKEGVDAGQACPDCGKPLVEKWGRFGKFLACSTYPECKFTKDLGGRERPADEPTDELCPTCGKAMVIKHGRFGKFMACSGYPECKTTKPIPLGIACPQDGGPLVERRSKRGKTFYACANYPAMHFFSVVAAGGAGLPPVWRVLRHRARRSRRQDHPRLREGRLRLQGRRRFHGRLTDRLPMPDQRPGTPRPDDSPVSAFLQYLAGERAASPHTLRGYTADLAEFRRFMRATKVGGWEDVDARALRGYLAWLHGRGLARTSIARKLAAVRSCFRFLTRRGVLPANPARHVRSPRLGRRLPSFLPKDESKDLLDATFEDTDAGRRDRALLELLYACGLRVAECCGLDLEDVDRRQGTVRVLGKGQSRAHGPGGGRGAGRARAAICAARPPRARRGGGAAVPQPARGAPDRAERAPDRGAAGARGRHRPARDAAYAAPHLRHPPARRGRRPAPHPGAPGASPPLHHPALHPREPRAPDEGVRRGASPRHLMSPT